MNELKIAIVADWLTNFGGAENVISAMHEAFPDAPIYTTVYNKEKLKELKNADLRASFLQKFPFAKKNHKPFLSFMPHAIERLDLSKYDIIISSSHSIAKGVLSKVETFHFCYCHNPMRYCWDDWQGYVREWGLPEWVNQILFSQLHKIRIWDRLAAERPDYYMANSHFVARRIWKYYRKKADVLPPPVNIDQFSITDTPTEDYFLATGRLIPYKRFDLIIEACNKLKMPLKIAGKGPEMQKLKSIAGNTVEILGYVDDQKLLELYQNCKALIFPQIEDAGIVPLEAMACGRPVIALNKGGAAENIVPNTTGIFFEEQSIASLTQAIESFNSKNFTPEVIRNYSEKYARKNFITNLKNSVFKQWEIYKKNFNNYS